LEKRKSVILPVKPHQTINHMKTTSLFLTKIIALSALFCVMLLSGSAFAEDSAEEPLADRLREVLHHEAFTLNALIQTGAAFSFDDDDFVGGRAFSLDNARVSMRGKIDGRFFYRVLFNLASEPNILDAYIGYHQSDAFRVSIGAMKPQQTADYIPHPGATDFISRAAITGLLVQSREIGLAAEGDHKGFYYYAGLFNGTGLSGLNNNKFYGIGRLQYTFDIEAMENSTLKVGLQGSHGDTPGVLSGNSGPTLSGKRTIFGGDLRLEANKFLFAAEYLTGDLEVSLIPGPSEVISGFYFTTGYWVLERTMVLGRWQSYAFDLDDFRDNQLSLGLTHLFTDLTSFLINFETFFPEYGDAKYGVMLGMQVMF
jgi:hypothetical protein